MGDRRAPHSRQNLAWTGFSCWHRGHFMRTVPRSVGVLRLRHAETLKGSHPNRHATPGVRALLRRRASTCAVGGTLNGKQGKGWMGGSTAPFTTQGLGAVLMKDRRQGAESGPHEP